MLEINWNPSRRDLRQFAGIWLPIFAAIFGATLVWRSGQWRTAEWIWGVAAAIGLVGSAAPSAIRPLFVGWMAAAYPIGWALSRVVFAMTYFGLFAGLGGLMRLFGYDPLQNRPKPDATSYWSEHEQRGDATSYFRQF